MKNNKVFKTALTSLYEKKEEKPSSKPLPASSAQIKIPAQRPKAPTSARKPRKTQLVTKEWTSEAAHTDQVSLNRSITEDAATNLPPKKVQYLHLKKTKAVLQKMQEMHEKAKRKVGNKVSIMKSSKSEQKLETDQDELWRDMMKPHEERHFQIGRVTNYFS